MTLAALFGQRFGSWYLPLEGRAANFEVVAVPAVVLVLSILGAALVFGIAGIIVEGVPERFRLAEEGVAFVGSAE